MDLPLSGFEFTFIIIAFVVVTLFSVASVCFRPEAGNADCEARKLKPPSTKKQKQKQRVISKQAELML